MNNLTPPNSHHHASRNHRSEMTESRAEPASSYEQFGLELLLYGIQSPINIGIILRQAEAFRFNASILDEYGVMADPVRLKTIEDFACGALSRRPLHRIENRESLDRLRSGRRMIATWLGQDTVPLPDFQFERGDVIVLGNEYDGLPDEFAARADARLHIPTPTAWLPKKRSHSPIDPSRTAPVARDGEPSLNVAVTAGIVCYAAYSRWLATVVSVPDNARPSPT